VTAPNGEPDLLLLREMNLTESVSGMYRMSLSLLSETPDIKFEDMIGGVITVQLELPEGGDAKERYFHGVISRFSQGPPSDRFITYQAEVVPWLWMLTCSSNCRIFQHKTIPDIITEVFDDLGMSDYQLKLNGSYDEREYVVQYRETDCNFVCRLMEEAGISYYFEHDDKTHTMVLFDDPAGNDPVIYSKVATYASLEEGDRATGEIEEWNVEQLLPSGKYAITDYNFQDPSMDLMADTPSTISIGGNDRFEIYDYPGEYDSLGTGQSKVKLRMEAEEAASYVINGQSARADFAAGATFDLEGHFRDDFDKTYLLTSVVHNATQGYGREGASSYSNSFTCIPHEVPFRPIQRTPKPLISGAQTATVVGASGEEIDVDEFGRVIVKFHWDRSDARDETSSCRVRVSQNWAGKAWGAIFHPRIGQEVIVEFLEGDPDRPIITGRVYNGEQTVPFDLPADKHKSGIKSRSTKEGANDNFNEIRFEDQKGSELVAMQAEKDLTRLVKNDEADTVGHDRSRAVANDETIDIGNDRVVTVGNEHKETIGKDETLEVGGQRERIVGKDERIKVGGEQEVQVDKDRTLIIKGTRSITTNKDHKEAIDGDQELVVGKSFSQEVGKKITIEAGDQIILKTGSAEIKMEKNGNITIKGKKISVKGSGDVIVKGSKVAMN
jgi:type VI secretion system secreted protein VgrG